MSVLETPARRLSGHDPQVPCQLGLGPVDDPKVPCQLGLGPVVPEGS